MSTDLVPIANVTELEKFAKLQTEVLLHGVETFWTMAATFRPPGDGNWVITVGPLEFLLYMREKLKFHLWDAARLLKVDKLGRIWDHGRLVLLSPDPGITWREFLPGEEASEEPITQREKSLQAKLEEIRMEIDGHIDGAPDRGEVARLANSIAQIIDETSEQRAARYDSANEKLQRSLRREEGLSANLSLLIDWLANEDTVKSEDLPQDIKELVARAISKVEASRKARAGEQIADEINDQSYARELERQLSSVRARLGGFISQAEASEKERSELRLQLSKWMAKREDLWVWQGDGEDHLESLTCDVLIDPQALLGLFSTIADLAEVSTLLYRIVGAGSAPDGADRVAADRLWHATADQRHKAAVAMRAKQLPSSEPPA